MLSQILTQGTQSAATGRDRRRSERKPHVAEAWLSSPTATDADDRIEVVSLNLSRHGVGFDSETSLAVGTFHIIEVKMGDKHMHSEIRIVSCSQGDDGEFIVGAEFC